LTNAELGVNSLSQAAAVLECLLLASDKPLSLAKLAEIFPDQPKDEWRRAIEELQNHYESGGHGIFLAEVAGGYQLRTRQDYAQWICRMRPAVPQRLTQAALETLAVIAYKQPIIRSEIEAIRGVDVAGILRQLLDKGLIQMLGRKDIPGRPILYGTTQHFLQIFGLRDLRSLPTQDELAALTESELAGSSNYDQQTQSDASAEVHDEVKES
jgi:segregation and condensation protein B